MKNRVPTPGKEGRMLITPENGDPPFYATVKMADDPMEDGTPLNKSTLLKDTSAALFGLDDDAVPDDVLAYLGKYSQHWWRRKPLTSTDVGEVDFVRSNDRNAYPDSGESDGYDWKYLGVPFDNAVTASRVELGSYVGTGTYGADNPTIINLPFEPKFILVTPVEPLFYAANSSLLWLFWIPGMTRVSMHGTDYCYTSVVDGQFRMYNPDGYTWYQCNDAGKVYLYLIIG